MARTKGSFTYRGHVVNFETAEKDGRWECTARFKSGDTSLGMSHSGIGDFSGFASKKEAEAATMDIVKDWINNHRPDSPPA
jgi:hypothetical protein